MTNKLRFCFFVLVFFPLAARAASVCHGRDAVAIAGVMVLYPEFIPARFSLDAASTSATKYNETEYRDYAFRFCDAAGLCFSIESAYGEIGDGPDGDRSLTGTSEALGPFSIAVFNPGSEDNDTNHVYYLSDWLKDRKLIAAEKKGVWPSEGRYHHFLGHGVSDEEAVKILSSLKPRSTVCVKPPLSSP